MEEKLGADKQIDSQVKPLWQRRAPVQILALAILTSILTMTQGYYKSEKQYSLAMLSQIEAQDLWSLYAAKDIKSEFSRLRQDSLTRERLELGESQEKLSRYLDYSAARNGERIGELSREKHHLYFQAKDAEYRRDLHIKTAQTNILINKRLGMAILFFQVSIMLLSVSSLVEDIRYYKVGNLTTLIAFILVANSFFPFIGFYP